MSSNPNFTPTEFFSQWHEILRQLFVATFRCYTSGEEPRKSKEEVMEKFVLDVEAAATSLCVENGVPSAKRAETEQQLRSSSSMLLPILLTVFFAGNEPVSESLFENNPQITLLGSAEGEKVSEVARYCNSRLDSGDRFLRAADCQGEVYLLPGAGVFKPKLAKVSTMRLRAGFKGFEYQREIAAFMVDEAYGGFARVPPTLPVTIVAESLPDRDEDMDLDALGSLQKWVHSVSSSEDMGSSCFKTSDVHRIGILDVLLYNTDRHGGNILVSSAPTCGKARLVPIDHGLCLPEFSHLDQAEFEWLYWKQARVPFPSEDLDLIASFDGDKVAGILRPLGLSPGSILTARIMVTVLHETAVERGWNLHKIGMFCTKQFSADSSALQDVVSAVDLPEGDIAFENHAIYMDAFKQKLVQFLHNEEAPAMAATAVPISV